VETEATEALAEAVADAETVTLVAEVEEMVARARKVHGNP